MFKIVSMHDIKKRRATQTTTRKVVNHDVAGFSIFVSRIMVTKARKLLSTCLITHLSTREFLVRLIPLEYETACRDCGYSCLWILLVYSRLQAFVNRHVRSSCVIYFDRLLSVDQLEHSIFPWNKLGVNTRLFSQFASAVVQGTKIMLFSDDARN